MKMTIRRAVKCTGCIRFDEPIEVECTWPVPSYIPKEQGFKWMKMYHEIQVRCPDRLTPERFRKELFELGK